MKTSKSKNSKGIPRLRFKGIDYYFLYSGGVDVGFSRKLQSMYDKMISMMPVDSVDLPLSYDGVRKKIMREGEYELITRAGVIFKIKRKLIDK